MTTPFLKNSTVKSRLTKVAKSKRDLKTVFDREMRRMDAEIADIQARCGHTNVEQSWEVEKHTFGLAHGMGECESSQRVTVYTCAVCGYTSRFPIEADPKRAKEVQQKQACPRAQ